MSIYNEDWNPDDYIMHGHRVHRRLIKNNLSLKAHIPANFIDYHSNEGVPCLPYERATQACYNTLGFMTPQFFSNAACVQSEQWWNQCVLTLKTENLRRKYFPEDRLDNPDFRPVMGIKDIL